jgi:hypothetical protein
MVADVVGHVAAMGEGCSEVGWQPAWGFWKNVRTKRTMRTKSVGRGPMEISRGTGCGLRAGSVETWGCRPQRKSGRWLLAAALEWPLSGIVTVFRSQLSAFRVRHTGEYFWACWGVRGGVGGRGKIRDGALFVPFKSSPTCHHRRYRLSIPFSSAERALAVSETS